ncbi:MAG: type II toxin-antitoxin system Phd/YefM family antitoxin [Planctomycetota bacterium]|jgi:PHD/YefM family antitoxin component YafN of YafNO toxin-antitoxin module|nr:type II toxin-antitoxin system Phd/YefM family antitoxin [Planctomycetota bacterium]
MQTTNLTHFRRHLTGILAQTLARHAPIGVCTKSGAVVIIGENDYNLLIKEKEAAPRAGWASAFAAAASGDDEETLPDLLDVDLDEWVWE